MLKISDVTAEKIRNNELKRELPEFYELKGVIENNIWHSNDSTFNHILTVLEELNKLLKKTSTKINHYLNRKIGKHSRRELLLIATLFHDIAKKDTLVKDGVNTSFPEHEKIGSFKVKRILNRFDLSEKEKSFVRNLIKNHGVIHLLLNQILLNQNDDGLKGKNREMLEKYKKHYKTLFIELILLAMADTLGCQLKENEPENFRFRIKFFKNIIDNY